MTPTEQSLRRVLAGLLRVLRHTRACRMCIAPETAIDEPARVKELQGIEREAAHLLASEHKTN